MDELLAFLPIFDVEGFEPTESWAGGEVSPGVFTWRFPNYRDEVDSFMHAASRPFWVDRHYLDTDVETWFEEPNVIAEAGLGEIKSLLTYIVRGERFCDGHVGQLIEGGHVQRLLRRLAELRRGL